MTASKGCGLGVTVIKVEACFLKADLLAAGDARIRARRFLIATRRILIDDSDRADAGRCAIQTGHVIRRMEFFLIRQARAEFARNSKIRPLRLRRSPICL